MYDVPYLPEFIELAKASDLAKIQTYADLFDDYRAQRRIDGSDPMNLTSGDDDKDDDGKDDDGEDGAPNVGYKEAIEVLQSLK